MRELKIFEVGGVSGGISTSALMELIRKLAGWTPSSSGGTPYEPVTPGKGAGLGGIVGFGVVAVGLGALAVLVAGSGALLAAGAGTLVRPRA